MEYLLVMGFAFLMAIPLLIVFYQQQTNINEDITDSQIVHIADEIMTAVNSVYYLGPPSQQTITVYFPASIDQIIITDRRFEFHVRSSHGIYEVERSTPTTVSGTLQTYAGTHIIKIVATDTGVTIND